MEEDLAKYGEDELIVNALKVAGGDFWQVTRDLEAGLRREETSAVEEYVHQSAGVAELRLQIEQCDGVLSVFEDLLHKCQSDLGNIAGRCFYHILMPCLISRYCIHLRDCLFMCSERLSMRSPTLTNAQINMCAHTVPFCVICPWMLIHVYVYTHGLLVFRFMFS